MDRDTRADYAPHCAFRYSKIALGGQLRRFSKRKKRLLTRFTTFKLAHPRTPHRPRVGSFLNALSTAYDAQAVEVVVMPRVQVILPSVHVVIIVCAEVTQLPFSFGVDLLSCRSLAS